MRGFLAAPGLPLATALCLAAAVSACSSGSGVSTDAACANPTTSASTATAAVGDRVAVSVVGLVDGCADTGEPEVVEPQLNAPIVLEQNGRRITLGTTDARGTDARASADVVIPAGIRPGRVGISIGSAAPAQLTVTAT